MELSFGMRHIWQVAQAEARLGRHEAVKPGHLLIALLRGVELASPVEAHQEVEAALAVVEGMGIDHKRVISQVARGLGWGSGSPPGRLPASADTEALLSAAEAIAGRRGSGFVQPVDLVTALVEAREPWLVAVLGEVPSTPDISPVEVSAPSRAAPVKAAVRPWEEGGVIEGLYRIWGSASGGMGTVYFAHHLKWDVDMAVKTPHPKVLAEPKLASRFLREAETWVELGKHPNVATAFYVRKIEGIPRIFIEYVAGGSLRDWMEEGKVRDILTALDVAIQVCDGMAHSHTRIKAHLDLKPGNVLMTTDGEAKVTDFGIVKRGAEEAGGMGTPPYMAPEQFERGATRGPETDVYAFGVMLFEVLCGKLPVGEEYRQAHPDAQWALFHQAHQSEVPLDAREERSEVPESLATLIARCLNKHPADRYHSFTELRPQLVAAYEQVAGHAYPRRMPSEVELRADDLNNRALSYLDLGRKEDARRCLEEAIELDPGALAANVNLGLLVWEEGWATNQEILERFEMAVKAHPDEAVAHYYKALIHVEWGEWKEALESLEKSLQLNGSQAKAWNLKGVALSGFEQYAEAETGFHKAVELEPDRADYKGNLGAALYEQKKYPEALEAFTKALELQPGEADRLVDYAVGLSGVGDLAKAREALEQALQLNPDSIRVNLYLGELLAGIIDYVPTFANPQPVPIVARQYIERAHALAPHLLRAGDAYEKVTGKPRHVPPTAVKPTDLTSEEERLTQPWTIKLLSTLEGHRSSVISLAITPDGRRVVSGGGPLDPTLGLWDLATKTRLRILEGHTRSVTCVAITPDGKRVVSGSEDKTLKVWELETGMCVRTLQGHMGEVKCVAITPDGKRVVSGSEDKTLKVWELETGMCVRTLQGHTGTVNSVAVMRKGQQALSASSDGTLRLWDLTTSQCLYTLEGHTYKVGPVAVAPDGRWVLSGGYGDQALKLWDLEMGRCHRTSEETPDFISGIPHITGVSIGLDGRWALSGGTGVKLKLWDLSTGICVRTLAGHTESVKCVAFAPDGRYAVSGSYDRTLGVWALRQVGDHLGFRYALQFLLALPTRVEEDLARHREYKALLQEAKGHMQAGAWQRVQKCYRRAQALPGYERDDHLLKGLAELGLWGQRVGVRQAWCRYILEGHSGAVNSVAISPEGRRAVSGSMDDTLRLWDLESGMCLKTLEGHRGSVNSVAIAPDGRRIVSGSGDSSLKVWDLEGGICLRNLYGHTARVNSVAISPDGRWVVSGSRDETLRLWDLERGVCLSTFKGHTSSVECVAVMSDGRCVVSGDLDGMLRLWDLEAGTCLRALEGHSSWVMSIALMSDGHRAVSASHDKTLKVWDLAEGVCLLTLEEPPGWADGWIDSVAISPDGRWAVSGGFAPESLDQTIKLWDLATGRCRHILKGHQGPVSSIAFAPNGRFILSASDDKTLRLWEIDWEWEFPE